MFRSFYFYWVLCRLWSSLSLAQLSAQLSLSLAQIVPTAQIFFKTVKMAQNQCFHRNRVVKKKLALGFGTAEHTALARYLFHRPPGFKRGENGEFFLIDPWKHDRDVVWSITQDLPNNVCQQQIIGRKTVVDGPTHVIYIAGTFLGVSHFGLRHGKEPTSSRRK